jgi:hypothetical protein
MKTLLLICFGCLIATIMQAQIIHVPADYPTIQQGIYAATNGDTVLVSDGTYYEQINFLGKKPLIVASEFIIDGDTNHIANTIIDGSQITNLDSASVVYFISGEDTTSVLAGITVQQGKGTISGTGLAFRGGGGVFIAQSGAKIIYSHVTQNHLNDTLLGNAQIVTGAGIHTIWEESDNWVVIDHNVIDHNSCYSSGEEAGSVGADIACNSRVTYNTIAYNEAIAVEYCHSLAAGFACWTDPSWNDTVTAYIQHNFIKNNLVSATNSYAVGAGGIIWRITGIFTDNLVENNEAEITNHIDGGGAGIYIWRSLEGTAIHDNIFRENQTNKFGAALFIESHANDPNSKMVLVENNYFQNNHANIGGALSILNNVVMLQNNVFAGNEADDRGGAVYLKLNSTMIKPPHLIVSVNNSFYGNNAVNYGGAIYSIQSKSVVFNSIFFGDGANAGTEIYSESNDTLEIGYSDIDPLHVVGGYFIMGDGNINENPLYGDLELLTLADGSPCLNTGTDEYTCHCNHVNSAPGYDIAGNIRPLNGQFEMGAHEKLITSADTRFSNTSIVRYTICPNPSKDKITIFSLNIIGNTQLSIYNVSGERVFERQLTDNETQIDISALPRGVYFVRVQNEKMLEVGKFIKN